MDAFLKPSSEYEMMGVTQAEQLINDSISRISHQENIALEKSLGRFPFNDVVSLTNIPVTNTSIVDGFAIQSQGCNMKASFTIAGHTLAGEDQSELPDGNSAIYVSTGAFIPRGADIVVPIEVCSVSDGTLNIADRTNLPPSSQNIRFVGSDTQKGDIILKKGVQITAAEVALLSACKVSHLDCFEKVRVSVASTGLEIHSSMVTDANRPYIMSRLNESDFSSCVQVTDLGILKDDPSHFSDLLANSDFDVLITSGAVSKGMTDFFKSVLESHPTEWTVLFGQLNLKPGKPTTVAVSKDKKRIIFCLPGNPASCFVTFNMFVLPCISRLCGKKDWKLDRTSVSSLDPIQTIKPDTERPEYLRAVVSLSEKNTRVICRLVDGHQRSSRVASTVDTVGGIPVNALVIVPPGPTALVTDRSFDIVMIPGRSIRVSNEVLPSHTVAQVSMATKAAAFDRLVDWLKIRNDVENIDLMNLAGFCRNCLSKWLSQSDPDLGLDVAKNFVYGMDYEEWKKLYRKGERRDHEPRLVVAPSNKSNPCASSIQPPARVYSYVLTVSDRASSGVYEDKSGPAAVEFLSAENFGPPKSTSIVPDEGEKIRNQILAWVEENHHRPKLIITSGGTGHSDRDLTAECIIPLLTKRSWGLEHLLLSKFIAIDTMFSLTRPVVGLLGSHALVVCLPGRPEAVREGLSILKDPIRKLLSDMTS